MWGLGFSGSGGGNIATSTRVYIRDVHGYIDFFIYIYTHMI